MSNIPKRRYLYFMLAGFGAISMSVLFFFVVYRFQGLGDWVNKIVDPRIPKIPK